MRRLALSGALQERRETAGPIERGKVIKAAHMLLTDENLGHGPAAGDLDHAVALSRIVVDADLMDLLHAALTQQRLGRMQ